MIIYLHGFNSGFGEKAETLIKEFPDQEVVCFDFKNTPIDDFKRLENTVEHIDEPIYIVGTSMGGFYGLLIYNYLCELGKDVKAFLINPSIPPSKNIEKQIGKVLTNYKTGEKFIPDLSFVNELKFLEQNYLNKALGKINEINFYISSNDEVIDHDPLISLLYKSQKPYYIEYSKQNHKHQDISGVIRDLKEFVNTNY